MCVRVCAHIHAYMLVGEPLDQKIKRNLEGWGATEGLKANSYVKQPAGSESGLRL